MAANDRNTWNFAARGIKSFHQDERGMITWAFMVIVLFLLVLSGFVYNAGNTINRKIETQNAADAAAYTGTLWTARYMNSITATNHLIGELNGLYIVHHSLGGKWLDENSRSTTGNNTIEVQVTNVVMQVAHSLAGGAAIPTISAQYDKLQENPSADINSTIYEAKLKLKKGMAIAYGVHAAAILLRPIPFGIGPALEMAIQAACLVTETAIWKEYLVLDGVEMIAYALKTPKKALPGIITVIHGVQKAYRLGAPVMAVKSASDVAQKQHVSGAIYGDLPDGMPRSFSDVFNQVSKFAPTLPIEQETTTYEERSQLMRGTYPWVTYWRTGITKFLRHIVLGAPISGAGDYYMKWTNRYSIQTCVWMRRDPSRSNYVNQLTVVNYGQYGFGGGNGEKGKGVHLFVMVGLNGTPRGVEKSREPWNDWSSKGKATAELEKLFCHVSFAHGSPPKVLPKAFFRQENPQGIVCFAQSMLYNANPQQRPESPKGGGSPQAKVGWDTLAWIDNACEYPMDDYVESPPRIKLNWQAKLSPVTPAKIVRVMPAAALTDAQVRKVAIDFRESLFLSNQ